MRYSRTTFWRSSAFQSVLRPRAAAEVDGGGADVFGAAVTGAAFADGAARCALAWTGVAAGIVAAMAAVRGQRIEEIAVVFSTVRLSYTNLPPLFQAFTADRPVAIFASSDRGQNGDPHGSKQWNRDGIEGGGGRYV